MVITESIAFSIHITHSLSPSLLTSDEGRAAPQDRHTVREPKFVSGHDGHFQSPGLAGGGDGWEEATSIGSGFPRRHW